MSNVHCDPKSYTGGRGDGGGNGEGEGGGGDGEGGGGDGNGGEGGTTGGGPLGIGRKGMAPSLQPTPQ